MLDPNHQGLVLATDARFHARVSTDATLTDTMDISVKSPQFEQSGLHFVLSLADKGVTLVYQYDLSIPGMRDSLVT